MAPTVVFGDIRGLELNEITPILQRHGIKRLDSAAMYEGGDSERRLGDAGWPAEFAIDTKVAAALPTDGTLTPEKIEESSKQSLERLQTDKVNVLYNHMPDAQTPVEEQARGFDEAYRKGRFFELGLSNLNTDVVEEWLRIAKEQGYVKPTWFEGQYNLICRSYEEDLFPMLRSEGMHFAAYSPLGGGFLNGNLRRQNRGGQRFVDHAAKGMYLDYYDRPVMYDAFEKLEQISKATGLGSDELSLRWLMNHSQLNDGDVVILGASKVGQIEKSIQLLHKGPLDEHVVAQLDALNTMELQAASREIVDMHRLFEAMLSGSKT